MKRIVIIAVIVAASLGAAFYSGVFKRGNSAQAAGAQQAGAGGAQGARQGGGGPAGGRGGGRGQLAVELAPASRAAVKRDLGGVGHLRGEQRGPGGPQIPGSLPEITVKAGESSTPRARM